MALWRGFVLVVCGVVCAAAQIYPPVGGYPDGGGVGVPTPRSSGKRGQSSSSKQVATHSYQGVVESIKGTKLTLAPGDGRELEFTCTKETKYLREGKGITAADLKVGATVTIESRQNNEGYLFAVNVMVDKDAPASAPPAAAAAKTQASPAPSPVAEADATPERGTVKAPSPVAADPDDPGAPKIKRGKPERVKRAEAEATAHPPVASTPAPTTTAQLAAPPPAPPAPQEEEEEDARIVKAREKSESFTETLPNYMVQQMTTRYFLESRLEGWRALDILSTEVIYDKGKESYRNIRVNNRLVKKPIDEVGGSVSRGEFGSTLIDLFSMGTNAKFRRRGSSTCSGRPAWLYDFSVELQNSHWTTRYASHTLRPAYQGSVWLDQADMRTLRIEMQAREIPDEYPLDKVEWVVEYGLVRLGTTHEYLVPVHAENLACWRGTAKCARNSTDFRNYRRFTGESTISTTDSNIDFGADPQPAAAPKQKP
jgi:hypothetical protein